VKGTKLDGKKLNWADYKAKLCWSTSGRPGAAVRGRGAQHQEDVRKISPKGLRSSASASTDAHRPGKFMEDKELPWTCLFDKDQPMSEFYGIFSIPQAILVAAMVT